MVVITAGKSRAAKVTGDTREIWGSGDPACPSSLHSVWHWRVMPPHWSQFSPWNEKTHDDSSLSWEGYNIHKPRESILSNRGVTSLHQSRRMYSISVMSSTVHPQFIYWSPNSKYLIMWLSFGDRGFGKVIKIMRSRGWVLIQYSWCPCKKRQPSTNQGKRPKKKPNLYHGLPASRTVRQ